MISPSFTLTAVLGAIILQERTLRNMSQANLAIAARLHPVALSRIERGQQGDIGVETLHRLAQGLSTSGRPVTAAGLMTRAEEYRRRLEAGAERGALPQVVPAANATAAVAAGLVTGAALVALIAFLSSNEDEGSAPPKGK